jgi:hypothetical protein
MENDNEWQDKQLAVARELVNQGSKALREGRTPVANGGLREARAVLDMSEVPDHDEVRKLRAQLLNELGFMHQRAGDTERARQMHKDSADLCNELIAAGVEFRANGTATHINLAGVLAQGGDVAAAKDVILRATELVDSLLEDEGDEVDASVRNLAFGAHQTNAMILAQNEDLKGADNAMERALVYAEQLMEESASVAAQAAQGVQQVSALLFNGGELELALKWGEESEKLAHLAFEKLGQQALPIYVRTELYLISYHEKAHNFADAEDALWNAIDVAGDHPQLLARGRAFYEQCRKQADARLEEGGLPRDEVEEGLAEIEEKIEAMGGDEALKQALEQLDAQARQAGQAG